MINTPLRSKPALDISIITDARGLLTRFRYLCIARGRNANVVIDSQEPHGHEMNAAACYGSSYLSLNLIEKHIFTEDHEMHRDAVLEQIDKTISVELVKLNAEYKQDIRNYAQSKIEQDNANRLKQQQAESKREKSRLPFVR